MIQVVRCLKSNRMFHEKEALLRNCIVLLVSNSASIFMSLPMPPCLHSLQAQWCQANLNGPKFVLVIQEEATKDSSLKRNIPKLVPIRIGTWDINKLGNSDEMLQIPRVFLVFFLLTNLNKP